MEEHRHLHWLEKIQVQLATLAAVAAGYFLLWPAVRLADPHVAVAFIPLASPLQMMVFTGILIVLAGLTTLATVHSRPAGGLLAALLGVGGISLHSADMPSLLRLRVESLSPTFALMMAEVLLLSLGVFLASVVVVMVRAFMRRLKPAWTWKEPLGGLPESERAKYGLAADGEGAADRAVVPEAWVARRLLDLMRLGEGWSAPGQRRRRATARELLTRHATFLAVAWVLTVLVAMVLMRSGDRGQVLFATLVSGLLGVLIAHQLFPVPYSIVIWASPVLAAVVLYALGMSWVRPGDWMSVPSQAQALPIDWITAGCGGALLGYWISARIHETRHLENQQKEGA